MRIVSWNIASIRTFNKYDFFNNYDLICIQELRLNDINTLREKYKYKNYYDYWSVSKTPGYSGCGIYSKYEPLNYICDDDGRYIVLIYKNYIVINVYVMNSGNNLQRLSNRIEWDDLFKKLIKNLTNQYNKKLILIVDFNCAHNYMDVKNSQNKLKKPGFTDQERESFSNLLDTFNLVDTYRYLHPNTIKYSYFNYRHHSKKTHSGWRLDYILISKELLRKLLDGDIHENIDGSDHVPITCEINIFLNE